MTIIFVRHGESEGNRLKVTQGHHDYDLTDKGIADAKEMAVALKNIGLQKAYCSELKRCMRTANEILKFHPETLRVNTELLQEQNKGIYETCPKSVMREQKNKSGVRYHEFKPESGESLLEVYDKLASFCSSLLSESEFKNILVVSHGGPIACMLVRLLNKNIEDHNDYTPKNNTDISMLNVKNKLASVVHLNVPASTIKSL